VVIDGLLGVSGGASTASDHALKGVPSAARPGSFLLLAQKKRTKEKGLPRQGEPVIGSVAGIFRLAIHGSVGKRRASCA
jgi:hypothetical protein